MKVADLFVDLHLDTSSFTRELREAMARASTQDVNIKMDVDTRGANKELTQLNKNVKSGLSGLNSYRGRLAIIADALAAIGPAAIPIGAVAVPAVTALGTASIGTAGAVSTFLFAFSGVGDALKALSKNALEPTAANFEAMQQALEQLSPEAQHFTKFLFGMHSEVDKLQASAGKGLFPGLEEGLSDASARLPVVNGLLEDYGTTLGDIAASAGRALATDRWDVLFQVIRQGRPLLESMATATGNVAHGLLEILDAFKPLNREGTDWLVEATRQFDEWATTLDTNESFQNFVEYIRENGPEVADFFGQLAKTAVAIIRAWAPIGANVLPVLTDLIDLLGQLVQIPFVAELVSAASILRLMSGPLGIVSSGFKRLNTELAMTSTLGTTAGGAGAAAGGKGLGGIGGVVKKLAGPAGVALLVNNMGDLTHETKNSNKALSVLGETAGGALLGFEVGGPWGAAIGGGIGLLHGLSRATKEVKEDFIKAAGGATAFQQTLDPMTGKITSASVEWETGVLKQSGVVEGLAKSYGIGQDQIITGLNEEGKARDNLRAIISSSRAEDEAYNKEAQALLTETGGVMTKEQGEHYKLLVKSATMYEGQADALQGLLDVTDGVAGATQRLAAQNYYNATSTTAANLALQEYNATMNGNREATLGAFSAMTAYGQAVQNAKGAIVKGAKLDPFTEGGAKNRQIIEGVASAWNNLSEKAQAAPGAYSKAKAGLVDLLVQAGKSREEAEKLATQLLDMPDANAKVILDTQQAQNEIDSVTNKLLALHDKTITLTVKEVHAVVTKGYVEEHRQPGSIPGPGGATGGYVRGAGTSTSDSIPARLSNGEYVMRAAAVRYYGVGTMSRMNTMRLAAGGAANGREPRGIFGRNIVKDIADGLQKGFEALKIYRQLHKVVVKNLKGDAEKAQLDKLDRLQKLAERSERHQQKLEAATANLQGLRESQQALVESFKSAVSPEISAFGQTPGGIVAGLAGQRAAATQFVANIRALAAAGFPRPLIEQVMALGLIDGNAAAEQLLSLSAADRASVIGDFNYLQQLATTQGQAFGEQFYGVQIAGAKAYVDQLKKEQKHINNVFEQAADAFATQLAHVLGIKVQGDKKKKGTHDSGGWLEVGRSLVANNTGKPEAVLNNDQWQRIDRLVSAVERGGTGGGSGSAPLIGSAVIRETVDLERYERERAFRDRRTRVGG